MNQTTVLPGDLLPWPPYGIEITILTLTICGVLSSWSTISTKFKGLDLEKRYVYIKQKYQDIRYGQTGKNFRFLCSYIRPKERAHQLNMIQCLCFMLFHRAVITAIPLCGKYIVDEMTGKKNFLWDIVYMSFGFVCLQCGSYINMLLNALELKLQRGAKKAKIEKLQNEIYTKILQLPYSKFAETGAYTLYSLLRDSPNTLAEFPNYILHELLPNLIDLGTAVYLLYSSFNPVLIVIMGVFSMVDMGLKRYIQKTREKNIKNTMESHPWVPHMYLYDLEDFEAIKYYCTEEEELKINLADYARNLKYESFNKETSILHVLLEFVSGFVKVVGGFFVAYQNSINNIGMSTGDYILFSRYMYQFQQPILTLQSISIRTGRYLRDVNGLPELFEAPSELPSDPIEDVEITGGLKVDHLTFGYKERHVVLDDVSFEVPEGTTVALVGPSGSGKSTLIRLFFQLLDPLKGTILLNDVDIKKIDIYKYRNAISIVPQDCQFLGYTSVRENINYGRLAAEGQDVDKAAKIARIEHLLKREEQERNTTGISGGEKQRVGIARAMLKEPKFLFLDEATSSLDSVTERQIQVALMDAAKDKTCVIVAHRLSTIAHADNIIVLKDGKIEEQGTHDNLLAKKGLYSEMWDIQQGEHLREEALRLQEI